MPFILTDFWITCNLVYLPIRSYALKIFLSNTKTKHSTLHRAVLRAASFKFATSGRAARSLVSSYSQACVT